METTPENIKKLRFWFELPIEIGACVMREIFKPPPEQSNTYIGYMTNDEIDERLEL